MDLQKLLFGTSQYISRTDTEANNPYPDPNDVWAFTDPDAREVYTNQGQLQRLEQDIRFEIMCGVSWQHEELAYKAEIRRLLREGAITDKGTYWYRSPHPTVYRAQRDGTVRIFEWVYPFHTGNELTFQCRMERDEAENDPSPALVSHLEPAEKAVLCGEMTSAMRGLNRRMNGMA